MKKAVCPCLAFPDLLPGSGLAYRGNAPLNAAPDDACTAAFSGRQGAVIPAPGSMPSAVRKICFIMEGDSLCFLSPAASAAGAGRTAGILCRRGRYGNALRKKNAAPSGILHPE